MSVGKQTRFKLKRGLHKVPVRYKVLSVRLLSEEDKKIVAKEVVKLVTPADIKKLVGNPVIKHGRLMPSMSSKWTYIPFGYYMPGGVLKYKGIEVAVFYRRTIEEIPVEAHDPIPEGWLEKEEDIWARFDLTGQSARVISGSVRDDLVTMERNLAVANAEIKSLTALLELKEKALIRVENKAGKK